MNFGGADGAEGGQDRGLIEARTVDGLTVNFVATFQYQLDEGGIHDLYMKYGENFKTPCVRLAVDSLSDQAAKFEASEFFRNLAGIGQDMKDELATIFQNECKARVSSLQLSKAELPLLYESALDATNIVIQDSITQQQRLRNVETQMNTQINEATIKKPILLKNAIGAKTANIE